MSKRLILASPTAGLYQQFGTVQGFIPSAESDLFRGIAEAGLWIAPRATLEVIDRPITTPVDRELTPEELESWKPLLRQPLPYMAIRDEAHNYLHYSRAGKGEEARLHGQLSIGLGGHPDRKDIQWEGKDEGDIAVAETLNRCAMRELKEELGLDLYDTEGVATAEVKWHGVIFDDANEVGKVHYAILGVITVSQFPDFINAEEDVSKLAPISLEGLGGIYDRLEPWSKIAYDYLKAA